MRKFTHLTIDDLNRQAGKHRYLANQADTDEEYDTNYQKFSDMADELKRRGVELEEIPQYFPT